MGVARSDSSQVDGPVPGSSRSAAIARADEELLASLGYKQEFQRAFSELLKIRNRSVWNQIFEE